MSLLLDAGALIAYERGDRTVAALISTAIDERVDVRTTSCVVAQVWRSGSRQVLLARLLRAVEEVELDRRGARRVGLLLGLAGTGDVVDGSIVDCARDGDEVLTSDPADIVHLANTAGRRLIVTPI